MGRIKKKRAVRDAHRQPGARPVTAPPFPQAEIERVMRLWDRAVDTGLMASGTDTKYHLGPDGTVLSVALGKNGQILSNGERLSPSAAERLRNQLPLLAGVVTFYENNQLAGRGLDGAPEDGVMPLQPSGGPDPMPPVDDEALAAAQAAAAVLVRQGKVFEPVGAMIIPAQRGGVLFAVGGRDCPQTSTGSRRCAQSGSIRHPRTARSPWPAAAQTRTATPRTDPAPGGQVAARMDSCARRRCLANLPPFPDEAGITTDTCLHGVSSEMSQRGKGRLMRP